jgi:hypothetical protein
MSSRIKFVSDVGTSKLKGVAKGSTRPYFLSMSPYCAKVPKVECDRFKRDWGNSVSIENSWVADIEGHYFLGDCARKYNGAAIANGARKNSKALYQTLGLLGAFAKQFGLPSRSSIELVILLPIVEYATSFKLIEDLKVSIQDFEYCGVRHNFKLAGVSTKPEGAGVILNGLPKGNPTQGRIDSMNGGHRNVSRIVMDGGEPDIQGSTTCDFGFRWLIERIVSSTGFTDQEYVLRVLIKGLDLFGEKLADAIADWPTGRIPAWVNAILNNASLNNDEREIIVEGLRLLPSYWMQIESWRDDLEQKQGVSNYSIAAGGGMYSLRSLVQKKKPATLWPDAVHKQVKKYVPNDADAFRFVDAMCWI